MKRISLFLVLLFSVLYAQAQLDSLQKAQHDRLLSQLFATQRVNSFPGAKTTGPPERLISMSTYQDTDAKSTWIRTDSARLTYGGTRGSVFNMENMAYNLFSVSIIYGRKYINYADFASVNFASPVLYDSLYYYQYKSDSVKERFCDRKYTGNLISNFFSSRLYDTNYTSDLQCHYDTSENLISARNLLIWPHTGIYWWTADYFFYNGKEQIIEDSSVSTLLPDTNAATVPDEKWEYIYDAKGQFTGGYIYVYSPGSWNISIHYTISYSAINQVGSIYQDDGYNPPFEVDSFSYSSGIPYYTFHSDSTIDRSTGSLSFQESDQKYVNTSGLVDSMIYLEPNYKEIHHYSYTPLGSPLIDFTVIYRADTLSAEKVVHYYYEPIPTAVQAISNPAINIQVYPNPATDELYFHSIAANTPLSLALYNAQGQLATGTVLTMNQGYSQFSIAHLAPGIYFLTLTDEKGTAIKKQTIIKQ